MLYIDQFPYTFYDEDNAFDINIVRIECHHDYFTLWYLMLHEYILGSYVLLNANKYVKVHRIC